MSIPKVDWNAVKTAYAAGIGLRELARNTGINANTIRARSAREGWTAQITEAKAMRLQEQPSATNVAAGAAVSLYERGLRHQNTMADLAERTLPTVSDMNGPELLNNVDKVDKFDRLARRQYGLDEVKQGNIGLQINILSSPDIESRGTITEVEAVRVKDAESDT